MRNYKYSSFMITGLAVGIFAGVESRADSPSFRNCEAGYNYETVDAGILVAPPADGRSYSIDADSGDGIRAACQFELLFGFYLHGEYREANVDLDVDVTSAFGETASASFDLDTQVWRLGAGYALDLPMNLSIYGQAAYTETDFDANRIVVPFPDDTEELISENLFAGSSGFDAEVGARWMATDRLEVGGFVRYTDVGSPDFVPVGVQNPINETGGGDGLRTTEDWRGGANAAFNIFGPAWVSARYEFAGDVDALFAGLRVAF